MAVKEQPIGLELKGGFTKLVQFRHGIQSKSLREKYRVQQGLLGAHMQANWNLQFRQK